MSAWNELDDVVEAAWRLGGVEAVRAWQDAAPAISMARCPRCQGGRVRFTASMRGSGTRGHPVKCTLCFDEGVLGGGGSYRGNPLLGKLVRVDGVVIR